MGTRVQGNPLHKLCSIGLGLGLLWGSAPRASSGRSPQKVTGEVQSDPSNGSLVPDAQKPAAEVEKEINAFNGDRAPPSGEEQLLTVKRIDGSDKFRVEHVDPNGPYAGKYFEGQELNGPEEIPGPEVSESPAKSAKDGPKDPSSH